MGEMAGGREEHPDDAEEGELGGVEGVDMGGSGFNLVTSHTGTGKGRSALSANGRCTITAPTAPLLIVPGCSLACTPSPCQLLAAYDLLSVPCLSLCRLSRDPELYV